MWRVFKLIKDEINSIIPAVVYFCLAFNFIHFSERLMLAHSDIKHYTYTAVTLGGIVMGKILIIANHLPFINAFPKKPLIYNIVWKTLVYSSVIVLFRIIEFSIHLFIKKNHPEVVLQLVEDDITSAMFWAIQMAIIMVFLGFIVFTEVANAIGADKMKQLLLGPPSRRRFGG